MTEYMTIDDLKRTFHIGNDKAYKLCNLRGFPAFRIGEGQWLIDPKGLDEWVKKLQKTNTKTLSMGMMISVNRALNNSASDYTADEMRQIMEWLVPDND